MIPEFSVEGYLPPGIHEASRNEFEERFVYFDRSDRRYRLFDSLGRLLDEVEKSSIVTRVLIAGSYITAKAEPNDFDCLLVLDSEIVGRDLRPFEYNMVSRRMARKLFRGDITPVLDESDALVEYMEFFQTTREGTTVGMVEINL